MLIPLDNSLVITFLSILIFITLLGVPIFLNSPTTVLKSIAILETFSPPAVEPAHPPTNIRKRRTVLENTGHASKSTVE